MDAVPEDAVNWSDVARPALTAAVAAFEHRKGRNMTTAVERLRASKQQADQRDKERGNRDGREWAENRAEYRSLRDLLHRRTARRSEDPFLALEWAVFPESEEMSSEESEEHVAKRLFPDEPERRISMANESDEYWLAFVNGALDFFKEVRKDVEAE